MFSSPYPLPMPTARELAKMNDFDEFQSMIVCPRWSLSPIMK